MVSQGLQKECGNRNTRWIDKLEGAEELGYGTYPVRFRTVAALVHEAQRNPFTSAREHKSATNSPGQKYVVI
jgi:hypothetical protein